MTIQTLLQPIIDVLLPLGLLITLIILFTTLVLCVLWFLTFIYQAKRKQWVWFVLCIFISPLWIIYWIVWLFNPKLKRKKK